jgi:hypothetical protein
MKVKKVISVYSICSTRWVPNGYGYPSGMSMGRALYPWVCVEFYTHQLYGYRYCIALPSHCHPYSRSKDFDDISFLNYPLLLDDV